MAQFLKLIEIDKQSGPLPGVVAVNVDLIVSIQAHYYAKDRPTLIIRPGEIPAGDRFESRTLIVIDAVGRRFDYERASEKARAILDQLFDDAV